jgi:hypothetical protein
LALKNTKILAANSVLKDVKAVVDNVDDYILSSVEATVGRQKLIKQEEDKNK